MNPEFVPSPEVLPEAFYHELGGGRYESTPATAGPWSAKSQHAGPPSALVGHAMERHDPRPGMRIARMTVELLRPVPVGDLTVTVRTVRSGGSVEVLEGEITAVGETVLLARAWRLVASPPYTPSLGPVPPAPALPGPQPPHTMADAHLDGYIAAMEWRFEDGRGFDSLGPGTAWARQRIPLVAGAPDSPLTRALTVADSSWAVGFELDHHTNLVINTDVTLALHRDPVGEWLCLRSHTEAGPGGSGLALGQLDDELGSCGRVLQTLLVTERRDRP
ncbi:MULTISPECIES: thioesterase family protein [unclassified Streptomyces]|uniref:acyl-CoA thioesterase domain-containing protein n=1 Tax=unclassified Streptomyces TaxID=2593676 RepID=UPI0013717DC6|nr:thioesterase family protein [Streptomyces sp. SID6139]MYR23104.1 thioesterase family protein [Streptomyces sp. SID6137]